MNHRGNLLCAEHKVAVIHACWSLPEPFTVRDVQSWILDKEPDVKVHPRHISRILHVLRDQGCVRDVWDQKSECKVCENKYKRSPSWEPRV